MAAGGRHPERGGRLRGPARRAGPADRRREPRGDGLAAAGPDPVAVHGRRPRPDLDVPVHARPEVATGRGAAPRAERLALVRRVPPRPGDPRHRLCGGGAGRRARSSASSTRASPQRSSGVLMAIPFFGPFVAWAPPVVVAFLTQSGDTLPAFILMGIGWLLVMNLLQPRLMQEAVGIHPIVVLGSVLIGAKIAGIAGRDLRHSDRGGPVGVLLPLPRDDARHRAGRGAGREARGGARGTARPRPARARAGHRHRRRRERPDGQRRAGTGPARPPARRRPRHDPRAGADGAPRPRQGARRARRRRGGAGRAAGPRARRPSPSATGRAGRGS